jgi:hypothetical protein
MGRIVITDSGQFEEVILELEESYSKLKDIFAKEKTNKEEIHETDTWTGNAQKAMYGKYAQLSENFEPIEYSIGVYIKFLKKTLEDYKREEEEINRNMELVAEQLNVNS